MEPLRVSLNHTLGRTVATSLTVVLSILPLALIGGGSCAASVWRSSSGL
jgi:preprotein translocase subunit SecF